MPPIKCTQKANRERAPRVLERLEEAYPDATCSLDYQSPLDLLVATILAAQCTDERVNQVTPRLFRQYRTAQDYVETPAGELEEEIRTCGFFRQKARSIKKAAAALVEQFGGEVPGTMEELTSLDGVGRKTANVILAECFGRQAIIVDTHCRRLSQRLGFTKNDDPARVEKDLMKVWPEDGWTRFSHCLVFHGRTCCTARAPRCSGCPVRDLCPFPDTREGRKRAR